MLFYHRVLILPPVCSLRCIFLIHTKSQKSEKLLIAVSGWFNCSNCHQESKRSLTDVQFSKTSKATVSVPFSVNTISHHTRMKHITQDGMFFSQYACACINNMQRLPNKTRHKFHELFVNQLHPL